MPRFQPRFQVYSKNKKYFLTAVSQNITEEPERTENLCTVYLISNERYTFLHKRQGKKDCCEKPKVLLITVFPIADNALGTESG